MRAALKVKEARITEKDDAIHNLRNMKSELERKLAERDVQQRDTERLLTKALDEAETATAKTLHLVQAHSELEQQYKTMKQKLLRVEEGAQARSKKVSDFFSTASLARSDTSTLGERV